MLKFFWLLARIFLATWPIWLWKPVEWAIVSYAPPEFNLAARALAPAIVVGIATLIAAGDQSRRAVVPIAGIISLWVGGVMIHQIWLAHEAGRIDLWNIIFRMEVRDIITLVSPLIAAGAGIFSLRFIFAFFKNLSGLASFGKRFEKAKSDFYGAAEWLDAKTVKKLGEKGGIILGQLDQPPMAISKDLTLSPLQRSAMLASRRALSYGTAFVRIAVESSLMVIAPPRTGKSAMIATNLLLSDDQTGQPLGWEGPTVTIDPKGAAYFICAARRRQLGRKVVLLDPLGLVEQKRNERPELSIIGSSDNYNFLDFVRRQNLSADLERLANAVIEKPKGDDKNKHFIEGAKTWFVGLCAFVISTEPPANQNLVRVRELALGQCEGGLDSLLEQMQEDPLLGEGLPAIAASLIATAGKESERGGFLTTVQNALRWLNDPVMRDHVTRSTFDPMKITDNDMDIFIVIPPEMIEPMRVWLRLWVVTMTGICARKKAKKQVLLIIDEMPALGRLDEVINAFRLYSGLGLSIMGFAQTLPGLEDVYGKQAVGEMLASAECVSFFEVAPSDVTTSEYLSKALGDGTFKEESESENTGRNSQGMQVLGGQSAGRSKSLRLVKRPLLLPQEIRGLKFGEVIIQTRSKDAKGSIHCWQAPYFDVPECAGLFDPDPWR